MTPIDEAALKAERAEFEKFARRNFSLGFASDDAVLLAEKDGLYVLTDIHMAWQAWQARALLQRSQVQEPVASELPIDVDGLLMHLKILGLDNERLCKQALRIAIASRSQPVAVVPAEQAEDWIALSDKVPDQFGPRLLVTNNKDARNSFGHHSHIWLTSMVHRQDDGSFCAFIEDGYARAEFLTHWRHAIPSDAAISNREAGGS